MGSRSLNNRGSIEGWYGKDCWRAGNTVFIGLEVTVRGSMKHKLGALKNHWVLSKSVVYCSEDTCTNIGNNILPIFLRIGE